MEQSEKIGMYSVGTNLLLVALKGIFGYLSGSIGLLADAVHSLTDVISSATVVAGIRLSRRKSKKFPYGLYKVENLVSLLSSIFIFAAGYEIVRMVFTKQEKMDLKYLPFAIGAVIFAMGVAYLFSRYEMNEGRKLASPALMADAKHVRTDMFSSIVILAGLAGGLFGLCIDKIAAVIVAVFVFKAGAEIFADAIRVLLDASLDFDTMDTVKSIISKDPDVARIRSLRGRNSGPFKFIEAEIAIRARDLERAHEASQRIEEAIKKEIDHVDQITIHYEPLKKDLITYAVPVAENKTELAEHFGEAPFFYIITVRKKDGSILKEEFLKNPIAREEKGKGIKVSKWLLEKGVDKVFSPKGLGGKGPGYVFSNSGVDVIIPQNTKLEEIKQGIQAGLW